MEQDVDGWSRYWAQGYTHSCPTSFSGYYGEHIQQFWRTWAADLSAEDSVLELGCGNGALLDFLADSWPMKQMPQLHGIDAATLDPGRWVTRRLAADKQGRIDIRGNQRIERLPMADSSMSAVVSQYGLEYADEEASWQQIGRVLKPDARLALLMHKRDGWLDRLAADEGEICAAILAAGGVLSRAQELLPYLARSHTKQGRLELGRNPLAAQTRQQFNQASQALQRLAAALTTGAYAEEVLQHLMGVLSGARPETLATAGTQLASLQAAIEDHRQRLIALQAAALDETDIQRLVKRMEQMRFSVHTPVIIYEQDHEFAWAIQARREAA